MKVDDISNRVISHTFKHIYEQCEEFEKIYFIKKKKKI